MVSGTIGVEAEEERAAGCPAPRQVSDRVVRTRGAAGVGPAVELAQAVAQLRDVDSLIINQVAYSLDANGLHEAFPDFDPTRILRTTFTATDGVRDNLEA